MAILTYKRANSITVNNVMILNITHNIFNLDDTDVFIRAQVKKFTSCLPMDGSSPGIPASSITKTGRHDIAEILRNVALNTC
jgi:hypothetical protein